MFITKNLPGLQGGISQQNPAIRPENCTQDQVNTKVSPTRGVELKRPPTEFIKALTTGVAPSSSLAHELITTTGEYLMLVTTDASAPIKIFTKAGTACTVTVVGTPYTYVNSGSAVPRDKIRVMGTQDYAFILNNSVTVTTTTAAPLDNVRYAYVTVNQGVSGIDWSIDIDYGLGSSGPITGTTASTDTNVIAADIASATQTAFPYGPVTSGLLSGTGSSAAVLFKGHTVSNGGASYDCIVSHVPSAATEPGVGANWATYWAGPGVALAAPAWSLASPGYIGSEANDTNPTYAITIKTSDGLGRGLLTGVSTEAITGTDGKKHFVAVVSNVNDLPSSAGNQYFAIKGDSAANLGYYLYHDQSKGTYSEAEAPGFRQYLTPATMPVLLEQTGATTFEVRYANGTDEYSENPRRAGDSTSNPAPSLVDQKITNMFFFKDRLAFTAGESVVMSQTGDYFNFFATTATEVLDTDPIDVTPDSDELSMIYDVAPMDQVLMLFTGKHEYVLHSGERALTTKTVSIEPASHFEYHRAIRPRLLGTNVIFAEKRGEYLAIRELSPGTGQASHEARELTPFLPDFIPSTANNLTLIPSLNLMLIHARDSATMYVYQYLVDGEKRIMSSWHKWVFYAGISTTWVFGNDLYMVDSSSRLIKMKVDGYKTYSENPFTFHLDHTEFRASGTGSYDAGTDTTSWTMALPLVATTKVVIEETGRELPWTEVAGKLTVEGDQRVQDIVVGVAYDSYVDLSEVTIRDEAGVAIPNVDIRIQKILVDFENTGYLKVSVIPWKRTGTTYEHWYFNTSTTGDTPDGTSVLKTDQLKQMILTKASKATIRISNDTYLPSTLKSVAFELDVVKESQ